MPELVLHTIAVLYVLIGTAIVYLSLPEALKDAPPGAELFPELILAAMLLVALVWPIGLFMKDDE